MSSKEANQEKVEGFASAETAVAATTKGSIADSAWEMASSLSFPATNSAVFSPKEDREALPFLRGQPTLPSNGNEVEQATTGVQVRPPAHLCRLILRETGIAAAGVRRNPPPTSGSGTGAQIKYIDAAIEGVLSGEKSEKK